MELTKKLNKLKKLLSEEEMKEILEKVDHMKRINFQKDLIVAVLDNIQTDKIPTIETSRTLKIVSEKVDYEKFGFNSAPLNTEVKSSIYSRKTFKNSY